jgi:hypothetical protein
MLGRSAGQQEGTADRVPLNGRAWNDTTDLAPVRTQTSEVEVEAMRVPSRRSCRVITVVLLVLTACSPETEQATPRGRVTEELRALLEADQREPQDPAGVPSDPAERRVFYEALWQRTFGPRYQRALELVGSGALSSGEDYFMAGMLINHGIRTDDYLTAHVLFTVAALKGHPTARWASAAALDGYLDETGKPQLFGTVYASIEEGWQRRVTGEPMTDALRRELCVPSLEKQGQLAKYLQAGKRAEFDREKVDCVSGE